MHRILLLALFAFAAVQMIGFAANMKVVARESAGGNTMEFRTARAFQKALKANDKKAVAKLVEYPVEREYPLPSIMSADELIRNWDDFFDEANISALVADTPSQMGWRGTMLGNGDVWFDGDKAVALNLKTKAFAKRFSEAKNKDYLTLHASARGYKHVAMRCGTSSKNIRIQEHGDGYHYFVWKKGGSLLERPELHLRGSVEFQGSAGSAAYTFENSGYRYELYVPRVCGGPESCDQTLTVSRNGKELSRQVCE